MSEENIFYSTKGAAEFLGVSERTIQNYRKEGILIPDEFGKNNSVLYSKKNLIQVVKRYLSSGETFLKKQPQVVKRYQKILEEDSQGVKRSSEVVKSSDTGVTSSEEKDSIEYKTRKKISLSDKEECEMVTTTCHEFQ